MNAEHLKLFKDHSLQTTVKAIRHETPQYLKALFHVIKSGNGSFCFVQRKLHAGYITVEKLFARMESHGILARHPHRIAKCYPNPIRVLLVPPYQRRVLLMKIDRMTASSSTQTTPSPL